MSVILIENVIWTIRKEGIDVQILKMAFPIVLQRGKTIWKMRAICHLIRNQELFPSHLNSS